jgi:hypothetical protein
MKLTNVDMINWSHLYLSEIIVGLYLGVVRPYLRNNPAGGGGPGGVVTDKRIRCGHKLLEADIGYE